MWIMKVDYETGSSGVILAKSAGTELQRNIELSSRMSTVEPETNMQTSTTSDEDYKLKSIQIARVFTLLHANLKYELLVHNRSLPNGIQKKWEGDFVRDVEIDLEVEQILHALVEERVQA